MAPLKEMTDAVEAIDSMEALTDYLGSTPSEDQIFDLYSCIDHSDLNDSSTNILCIAPGALMLNDSAEYQELTSLGRVRKDANTKLASRVLGKLGYSEEEAAEKIGNCLAFEAQLAPS